MKYTLDTNVLLRFLVGDNPGQQEQATEWFKEAERGQRAIVVHPLVVAESCFVLESFYKRSPVQIAVAMEIFLSQPWLLVTERVALTSLWGDYRDGLHFVDSFLLAVTRENSGELLSFDKKALRKN